MKEELDPALLGCLLRVVGFDGFRFAARVGVEQGGTVEALRTGQSLPDPKLDALATFTRAVARQTGPVAPSPTDRFLAAGYTNQQLLEVILGVATTTTISNNVAHFAHPALDHPFQAQTWTPVEHNPDRT